MSIIRTSPQKTTVSENEKDFILKGVLTEIKKVVTAQQFDIWFSCLRISSITDNSITFITPNDFIKDWLYNNYVDQFSHIIYKILNLSREVIFTTGDDTHKEGTPLSCSEKDSTSPDGKEYYETSMTYRSQRGMKMSLQCSCISGRRRSIIPEKRQRRSEQWM